jgi:uncharacterized damage-inducible protein DinB
MTDVPNYPVQAKLCETNDLFPSPERRVSWGSCYFEGRRKLALVAITGRLAEFLSIAARPRVSFAKERPDREREIKITQSSEVIAMDLLQSLGMMAGYNRWMNEKLYALCAQLPDEERKRDRKAFFRSIHGTLNHLLLTDRGWLGRFNGKPWMFRSLDQELHNNFEELCRERARTDREIGDFVAALSPESLAQDFTYQTYAGITFTHPLGPALVHLFNHQTHHRGQLTTLLHQLGIDPGVTDAMVYYRQHRLG